MIDILLFFIGASLLLYVVLGGSDYGAGIIELLPAGKLREKQKHLINEAMGPVWEANHIWLILVVVILFVGFPGIFITLMTALHLPMLALLTGVVVRGTMFTFRHYDAVQTASSQRVYTTFFTLSSVWTAFWLGVIVAAMDRGLILRAPAGFHETYVAPWLGAYPCAVGLFVVCMFTLLAASYMTGETSDEALRARFIRIGAGANVATILSGGLVFLASLDEKTSLLTRFREQPATLVVMGAATLMCVVLRVFVRRRHTTLTRLAAAAQVGLILLGWWLINTPNAIITREGPMSFYAEAATPATLRQLVIALLIGSLLIFPALAYLLKVFKAEGPDRAGEH